MPDQAQFRLLSGMCGTCAALGPADTKPGIDTALVSLSNLRLPDSCVDCGKGAVRDTLRSGRRCE